MSIQLKRFFKTEEEAQAFASGMQQGRTFQTHHVRVHPCSEPDYPFKVEWVEECNLDERYEIHPPTY